MKFGYRDRIILLIVLVVIILGVGIFLFIKPKWETLNTNKATLETTQADWDTKLLEFDRIPVRQESINKKYQKSTEIVKEFTDSMSSIELEEFLQKNFINIDKFKEDEVELRDSFTVSNEKTTTMNYYYLTPNIVTYPLYEYADLDGSLAKAAEKIMHDSNVLSSRTSQTVAAGTSNFTLLINREDVLSLLDAVSAYATKNKDAMLIKSVEIKDYDFNKEEEEADNNQQVDEDGNPVGGAQKPDETKKKDYEKANYTEVTINYEVYYMQAPTKPDVGPSYDKTIWDGNEWRNAVAE